MLPTSSGADFDSRQTILPKKSSVLNLELERLRISAPVIDYSDFTFFLDIFLSVLLKVTSHFLMFYQDNYIYI